LFKTELKLLRGYGKPSSGSNPLVDDFGGKKTGLMIFMLVLVNFLKGIQSTAFFLFQGSRVVRNKEKNCVSVYLKLTQSEKRRKKGYPQRDQYGTIDGTTAPTRQQKGEPGIELYC